MMQTLTKILLISQLIYVAVAQPPPGGGGGGGGTSSSNNPGYSSSATGCTPSSGTCSTTGSSNYVSRSLTYNATSGIFTGSMKMNLCTNNKYGRYEDGTLINSFGTHSASCVSQTFPAYSAGTAAPLRNAVAYTLYGGNIYGAFEAGFTLGQACDNNLGTCDAGLDLAACKAKLQYECGASHVKDSMMLDGCGGHATPYHHHTDLLCDYNLTAAGHSQLVGIALDGRGLYGRYESTGTVPTDLDACNGHYGPVPARTIDGVTYPAASNVYHYHTSAAAPYTVGCFGPVASLAACKSLYSTCGTGYVSLTTSSGCNANYDTDCSCFKMGSSTYNQLSVSACTSGSPGNSSTTANTTSTTANTTSTTANTASTTANTTGTTASTASSMMSLSFVSFIVAAVSSFVAFML